MQEAGWKRKQFERLCRIDDICREANIKMFLHGDMALSAVRDGDVPDYISICVEAADAKRFIDAISRSDDLRIAGMFNNPRYPNFNLKVYDPDTIDFHISEMEERGFFGLYVTVHLIRHIPGKKQLRKIQGRERAYKDYLDNRYNVVSTKKNRGKADWLVRLEGAVLPPDVLAGKMFDRHVRDYSGQAGKIQVSGVRYEPGTFENCKTINVLGRDFLIPEDEELYLSTKFGENWQERNTRTFEEKNGVFRDADHSWDEFCSYIDYLDFDEYNQRRDTIYRKTVDLSEYNRFLKRYRLLLLRTHIRFQMWERFLPEKEEILALYKAGDYEALEEKLADYSYSIKYFGKRGLGLFFDQELFDIAVELVRREERDELADKIVEEVPEEHRKPIRLKNYNGDYI